MSVITGPPGDRPEVLIDRIPGPMLILWGALWPASSRPGAKCLLQQSGP